MTKTTIEGREYKVEMIHEASGNHLADMLGRGWDGKSYMLTGKRGATKLAYRSEMTGQFTIIY